MNRCRLTISGNMSCSMPRCAPHAGCDQVPSHAGWGPSGGQGMSDETPEAIIMSIIITRLIIAIVIIIIIIVVIVMVIVIISI